MKGPPGRACSTWGAFHFHPSPSIRTQSPQTDSLWAVRGPDAAALASQLRCHAAQILLRDFTIVFGDKVFADRQAIGRQHFLAELAKTVLRATLGTDAARRIRNAHLEFT